MGDYERCAVCSNLDVTLRTDLGEVLDWDFHEQHSHHGACRLCLRKAPSSESD